MKEGLILASREQFKAVRIENNKMLQENCQTKQYNRMTQKHPIPYIHTNVNFKKLKQTEKQVSKYGRNKVIS